jgi:hypothetical protein
MRLNVRVVTALLLLASPACLHAQQAPAPRLPAAVTLAGPTAAPAHTSVTIDAPVPTGALLAVGLAAAGASAAAGAALGYNIDRGGASRPTGDDPGLGGLVVGWVVAPALVTPAVVHLANGQRGSLATAYAASAVIAGVGMITAHAGAPNPVAVVLVVGSPVLQAASAVIVERRRNRE